MSKRRGPHERQTHVGHTDIARRLRADMSATERHLWKHLRKLEDVDGKFRRQTPIGPYVADFAHHGAKLVIELDGPHHDNDIAQELDRARDAWLAENGYRVLRFRNEEVWADMARVLETIRTALGQPPHPYPSPTRGEGIL